MYVTFPIKFKFIGHISSVRNTYDITETPNTIHGFTTIYLKNETEELYFTYLNIFHISYRLLTLTVFEL
jgi:hypothetical protein